MEESDEGVEVQSQRKDERARSRKKSVDYKNGETGYCNVRIHELAQPKRWLLFYTYKDFQQVFETERAQAVKEKVQEMFGMTPEEAELYFNTIRQKKPRKVDLKAIRMRIRRERKEARREAYCIFQRVVCKAIKYAYKHAPPLLVTPMLRIVSDHMLELLAELHDIETPKRTNTDNLSQLLIAVSDWCALFVANIYYELEVQDRKEQQERIEAAALPESDSTITSVAERKGELATKLTDYQGEDESEREFDGQQEE